MKTMKISVATLATFGAVGAHAAGFEKATVFSGHYTGVGSAAVSSVRGGESLFFNPAGLAEVNGASGDVQLNYSPTFGKYVGPIVEDDKSLESKRHNSPIFGATSAYKINDQLGVGAGVFVSAGSRSDYPDIDYTDLYAGAELKPTAKSQISVLEASLGAGYELAPGLRIGAAWRAAFVNAALSSPSVKVIPGTNGATALVGLNLADLQDSNYSSFRLGMQYSGEGWGIGLNARSKLAFVAKGEGSGKSEFVIDGALVNISDVDPLALQGADVSISSQLPLQMELGGHFVLPSDLTLFASYNWTDYSQVKEIALTGKLNFSDDYSPYPVAGGELDLAEAPFKTRWKDQHMIKAGLQWDGLEGTPLRVGYAYVSQVTPDEFARATFAAPGVGQVFTAGAGYKIKDGLKLDAAFELAQTTGSVDDDAAAVTGETKTGDYATSAFVIHTGLSYEF